jgi:hypothetical protein
MVAARSHAVRPSEAVQDARAPRTVDAVLARITALLEAR